MGFSKTPFSLICLHILDGCAEEYRKVLKEGEFYFFNNWYTLNNGCVVKNASNQFERDFFGPNISIQAVVGKNGSGKSSLFEIIYRLINNLSYVALYAVDRATADELYYIRNIKAELYFEINETLARIACNDDELRIQYGEQDELVFYFPYSRNYEIERYQSDYDLSEEGHNSKEAKDYKSQLIKNDLLKSFFYTLVVNYSIQSLNPCDYEVENSFGFDDEDRANSSWLMSLFRKNDGYMAPIGFEPYRGNDIIDLKNLKELTEDRIAALLIDCKNRNALSQSHEHHYEIIPNYDLSSIDLSLNDSLLRKKNYDDDDITVHLVDIVKDGVNNVNIESFARINEIVQGYGIVWGLDDTVERSSLYYIGLIYLIKKTFQVVDNYPQYAKYSSLKDNYCDLEREFDFDDYHNLNQLIHEIRADNSHVTIKIRRVVNYLRGLANLTRDDIDLFTKHFTYDKYISTFFRVSQFESLDDIMSHYPPSFINHSICLNNRLSGKETDFASLSSGERQCLFTTSAYIYHLLNLISIHNEKGRVYYRNVCLFMDEIELCYHPEYQREYVYNLIRSIRLYHIDEHLNICILMSTHSPFVLSDIPQSNVLMLEDGISKSKDDSFNPFAANINDLLANRFFLKDGFMGEFAKLKLLELAEILDPDSDNLTTEKELYVEWLIPMIGEPLLREQFACMYSEKRFGNNKKAIKEWFLSMAQKMDEV